MKIWPGILLLLAGTTAWANGCATDPSYGYGCGAGYGSLGRVPESIAPPHTGGTSVRFITGHDGSRFVETAPSFTAHDDIRVIDYSGPYIRERRFDTDSLYQRFEID